MKVNKITDITVPDLVEVLNNLKDGIMNDINCVRTCSVVEYDPANQRASVQITIKQVIREEPNGVKVSQDLPILLDCPVMVLGGGGSYISHPVNQGDTGIVLFNDKDMDDWIIAGGQQEPNTYRKHDLSDGLVILGFRPNPSTLQGVENDKIQVQYSTTVYIHLETDQIVSEAPLWDHDGDLLIRGGLQVLGTITGAGTGGSSTIDVDADIIQVPGRTLSAGNGATGTFTQVTVVDGIVVGGT